MSRIYIMGDTHGNWRTMQYLCKDMTEDDIVIHVGDHGVDFFGNSRDNNLKKKISRMNPTFILIQGNHDNFQIKNYKEIEKSNIIKGKFFIEGEYPKILHCSKINTFSINNIDFLTLGGAFSIDKNYRIKMGWSWFSNEQIPIEEMNEFKEKYKGYQTDIIISHTCPEKYEPRHLFLPFVNQSTVDKRTEKFLDWVEENIEYKQWFLGHYHANEQLWDKGYMLFENIKEVII